MYHTIAEIKAANRAIGNRWFSPNTMRSFKCKVYDTVYRGKYFITSEQGPNNARKYTIREAQASGRISTVGKFQGLGSLRAAKVAVRLL